MDTRQLLLQQQTKLRQLLHTRGQWSNAQSLFLRQHAMLHSAAVEVGRRTREIVRNLQPTEAEERVDTTHIQALISAGALAEGAYDLAEYWSGKRKTALLAMPATRHSLTHLNQAHLVRKKLGLGF